jgi:hypothetical protein
MRIILILKIFIVGAILLWYVDEVTDVKKQNKKKLDVQDYKLALKILNEAKNQVAIIEDKKQMDLCSISTNILAN